MSTECSSLENDNVPMFQVARKPPPLRSKWICSADVADGALDCLCRLVPMQVSVGNLKTLDSVYKASSMADFESVSSSASNAGEVPIARGASSILGRGAYGVVSRMQCQGQVYAVKSIKRSATDSDLLDSLHAKEIEAQMEIKHVNVARLYRVFYEEDSLHLVMEHCAGGNLYQAMKKTRDRHFDERTTFIRFMQLVSGLTAIHAAGFHHRDMKLENLLLDSDGVLKITDFGWVSPVLGSKKHFSFCGTLDYLPPEMLQGTGHDWRMDIWAAGVLLYEMLVGRTAFNSTRHGILINKVFTMRINPFPSFAPEDFRQAVRSLLVYNHDRRLQLHDVFKLRWVQRMVGELHRDTLRLLRPGEGVPHQRSQSVVPPLDLGGIRPNKTPTSLLSPRREVSTTGLTRREAKKASDVEQRMEFSLDPSPKRPTFSFESPESDNMHLVSLLVEVELDPQVKRGSEMHDDRGRICQHDSKWQSGSSNTRLVQRRPSASSSPCLNLPPRGHSSSGGARCVA
ncbi:MAG: uncharacterized protein KVP18_004342 [Porospora cf. gigantea A]|uniref:uncharacterized protein n=1 Tax=Porospora cf. gigantea A TaxID=2853593 RepID=UPI00355AB917|nr:MAG: hypothetical protein KVP18_004342 [Porospora cf. gigantea A]